MRSTENEVKIHCTSIPRAGGGARARVLLTIRGNPRRPSPAPRVEVRRHARTSAASARQEHKACVALLQAAARWRRAPGAGPGPASRRRRGTLHNRRLWTEARAAAASPAPVRAQRRPRTITRSEVSHLPSSSTLSLLTTKGTYPYYVTHISQLLPQPRLRPAVTVPSIRHDAPHSLAFT
ncbi:hypothetical protein EVAR_96582_1 [Eumeta japonica]|uniref:Uncharacterized protein n=1 Tax=Eumeta variegata TaxID=151549 RepID=A0A4C1WV24_EUMVA|nr:hypothetical protein EVAR_96582_1 [Eumeta japonica]